MRWMLLVGVLLVGLAVAGGSGVAFAQEKGEPPIDFFVTPQVWLFFRPDYSFKHIDTTSQRRTPQAGLQLALRYGDFTLGVSGLFMEERYSNTDTDRTLCCATRFEERIDYVRRDIDYTVAYTFRDVIPNLLNVSLGLTVFTVHVEYDETSVKPPGGVLTRSRKVQVSGEENAWAVGPPIGLTFKLTDRLFLPFNVTPAWGERSDSSPEIHSNERVFFLRHDVGLRYLVSEQVSVFAGYKLQYASQRTAHDYYAHGPIVGLTVRFGLR